MVVIPLDSLNSFILEGSAFCMEDDFPTPFSNEKYVFIRFQRMSINLGGRLMHSFKMMKAKRCKGFAVYEAKT